MAPLIEWKIVCMIFRSCQHIDICDLLPMKKQCCGLLKMQYLKKKVCMNVLYIQIEHLFLLRMCQGSVYHISTKMLDKTWLKTYTKTLYFVMQPAVVSSHGQVLFCSICMLFMLLSRCLVTVCNLFSLSLFESILCFCV